MNVRFEDGVHDITSEEYHAAQGVSRSRLMLLDKSPYHFWYECLSGEAEPKSSKALDFGAAFHTMLLEPHLFDSEFAVKPKLQKLPEKMLLKDVGKEEFEKYKIELLYVQNQNAHLNAMFEREAKGKILLSNSDYEKTKQMVELIKRHEIVDTLLGDSSFEQSIFWTDKETGLQFKARPDIWSGKMIVDLKTSKDVNPKWLPRKALEFGYFLQAGMMHEACKSIGKPFEMFVILAIEKEAPFVPSIFIMNDKAIQYGIDQFQVYKKILSQCLEKDDWPSYPVQELTVPEWARKQIEEEL